MGSVKEDAMTTYLQFLAIMLPTILVIGLATATVVAYPDAERESPPVLLPHVQSEANRLQPNNG